MKQHVLRKEKEEGSRETYTVFKNPNEELRNRIANFKMEQTKVFIGWPAQEWTIEAFEDEEVRCSKGRNIHYFSKKEVMEALKEQLEEARNREFPAVKHFRECFGILSYMNDRMLTIIDLQGEIQIFPQFKGDVSVSCMGVEFYRDFYNYELNTYDGLSVKADIRGESMMLNVTPEGDFINRDYNQNLSQFKCEEISPKEFLKLFKKEFLKQFGKEKFEEIRGRYFSKKYLLQPFDNNEDEFGFEVTESTNGVNYKRFRHPAVKKPKTKGTPITPEEIFEKLINNLSPKMKKMMSDDYKTIIKEELENAK